MAISIKSWPVIHIFLTFTFFVSSLFINFIQLLVWIFIRPWNKWLYRKVNCYLLYGIWSQLVFLAEWWSKSEVRIFASDETLRHVGKEHAMVIMNHSYELDWLMSWQVCDHCTVLGNAKVYVKKMLKYVPIMGWAWVFAEIVFLERKWEQDHLTIASQLDIIAEYPDPIWLLLFCEGTRFTPEKHAASMEVARRKGLPEFKHVLLPRTKGFLFSVEQLRGKLPAIYSCTMAFNRTEGAEPTVMSVLNGKHVVCEVYFERIPLEEVPEDEKQASKWLFDLYAKKDKLLDSYYKTGSFTKTSGYPEMPLSLMKCRIYSLLNIIFWNVLVLIPVFIFVFNIICNASSISIVITISIMILVYLAVNKMIQLTKVSHGSSYGQVTASSQSSKSGSSLPNGQPTEDKKEL